MFYQIAFTILALLLLIVVVPTLLSYYTIIFYQSRGQGKAKGDMEYIKELTKSKKSQSVEEDENQ